MGIDFEQRDALGEPLVQVCERLAHFVALVVTSKSLYSDHFELLRRRKQMTTASELLWQLVPPLVLATDRLVLAALLEPCYDNGGDAFDYALNDDVLHFAVFDAMGHGLAAAAAAGFALSVYRHSRRRGDDPVATATAIDAALFEQEGSATRFVTAMIAQLHVPSGELRWVNAGHPPALLLRDRRLVKTLDLEPVPPLGTRLATSPPTEGRESLQPGDLVLAYTDGLTESRRPGGGLFTAERLAGFVERQAASGQSAPETLRRLREAIIEQREGALRDDATAVLVEWSGGGQRRLLPETV
jgi:serine phosphatase RsbU (regulator of sigma subunit)